MKAIALFARTTIVGGVFFLAPIVVLIVILAKAFGFAKTGLQAVVPHIPGISDLSVGECTDSDRRCSGGFASLCEAHNETSAVLCTRSGFRFREPFAKNLLLVRATARK